MVTANANKCPRCGGKLLLDEEEYCLTCGWRKTGKWLNRLYPNAGKVWSKEDVAYLAKNYGRIPDKTLCDILGRSAGALHIESVRATHICRTKNILTAREVARMLGKSCPKTIIGWHRKGWLKGKRAWWFQGGNQVWWFEDEDIESFCHRHPWLPNIDRMQSQQMKDIVLREKEQDPWYDCPEAAAYLGLKSDDCIKRYIKWGLLPPHRAARSSGAFYWIILESDLMALKRGDRRRRRAHDAQLRSRRITLWKKGEPVRIRVLWKYKCPVCRHSVRVTADPAMHIDKFKKLFAQLWTRPCRHRRTCSIIQEGR